MDSRNDWGGEKKKKKYQTKVNYENHSMLEKVLRAMNMDLKKTRRHFYYALNDSYSNNKKTPCLFF